MTASSGSPRALWSVVPDQVEVRDEGRMPLSRQIPIIVVGVIVLQFLLLGMGLNHLIFLAASAVDRMIRRARR